MLFAAAILAGLVMYFINPVPAYSTACSYDVTPSPASIPFADTTVGDSSASTTVTITNTSDCSYSLTSLSITLSGDSGEFSIGTNTCTGTLLNAESCQVDITFEPTAAASRSASLVLTTGEVTFSNLVALSGTGIAASAPSADSTALLGVAAMQSQDDSDGCNAIASTGAAGKKGIGPAALGLVAMLGLVMATAAVRRRKR